MEFKDTKTFVNLTRSFAGESQAGMRYQMAAEKALQIGYKVLSDEIKIIAKNETKHAKVFFDYIIKYGGNINNAEICAGYPFNGDTLISAMKFSVEAEKNESGFIYPEFSKIAKAEGYNDIAETYKLIAEVESHHAIIFEYLYNNFTAGTLYKNSVPIIYKCSECGYLFTSAQAWNVCPLCHASQGFVELHLPLEKNNEK